MELAYRYRAQDEAGRPVEGLVYARSAALAHYRVKHVLRRAPVELRLALRESVEVAIARDFAARDLALFYATLAARLERGQSVEEGLDDARDFVFDRRMVQAITLMIHKLREGVPFGEAMRQAGFPDRDAALVAGMSEAGRLPEALAGLARELDQSEAIAESIRALVQMPIAVSLVMYAGLYAALTVFMPAMRRFYEALGTVRLPPLAAAAYDVSQIFNAHLGWATALYLALPVAASLAFRLHGPRAWVERIPAFGRMAERADMSRLWGGFAVLYDAGVNVEESCRLLADAARRVQSRASFRSLGRQLHGGMSLVAATARAGFPAYVVKGVQAADSGGDLVGGLNLLAARLARDVGLMARRCEHLVRLVTYLALAVGVTAFFMVTYFPVLSVTLNLV
jgi:type II secretory pathway component PulF